MERKINGKKLNIEEKINGTYDLRFKLTGLQRLHVKYLQKEKIYGT